MLNALLIDLTMKFTNMSMGLFNWPTIKIGMKLYHPLLHRKQCPQFSTEKIRLYISVRGLTSKGGILSVTGYEKSLKITRKSGECELFCTIHSENDEDKICCLAVDENDNVFILVVKGKSWRRSKLLIFDANGNVKADRYLDGLPDPQMCVTKDGLIVVLSI
jgi:hypothetical protein